jgi:prepilin-type N-terminal cleavage/methylation domain-containing protein
LQRYKGTKKRLTKCHSALDAESIILKKWILAFLLHQGYEGQGARMTVRKHSGFTFVELMVALIVSSIIFSAIASLAYAVGAANDSSTEISTSQARIRFATVRIQQLLKEAKLITLSGSDDLAVWTSDLDNDNEIDPREVLFTETGSERNYIKFLDFPAASPGTVTLASLKDGSAKTSLVSLCNERRIEIIPNCSNVSFYPSNVSQQDDFVCISFDYPEENRTRHWQISSKLLCHADNLINGTNIESSDDD